MTAITEDSPSPPAEGWAHRLTRRSHPYTFAAVTRRFALTAGVAAMFAVAAPPAGAVTFGADLSQPVVANAPTCAVFGQPSCMGYNVVPTSYAPTSGTVTSVRVKTAAVTQGPMQVLVLRSYYQNNPNSPGTPNYFCCFLQSYGPTFTPTAGATTTVATSLGMVEQPVPPPGDYNTVAAGDFLALSILNNTTPVPLGLDPNGNGLAVYYSPAPNQSTQPAPSSNGIPGGQGAGSSGYFLMMNADLEPLSGGGGGGTTAAVGTGGNGKIAGSHATVPLVCQLTTACDGTLALRTPVPGAKGRTTALAAVGKALGTASFTIPAGSSQGVSVHLNKQGRKLVKNRNKVSVTAVATVGGVSTTFGLKLTR
jgi:hypothetical protein